jgi:hypothetical protein
VVELKPTEATGATVLSRWSRLKRAAADERSGHTTNPPERGVDDASATTQDGVVVLPNEGRETVSHAAVESIELPSMSCISLTEDFTPFMQANVPQALKQQALRALFKEPHFNVMDGLDIYIDDYTVFEPIAPEVMATLSSWKWLRRGRGE